MIARHEMHLDKQDIWAALAAPMTDRGTTAVRSRLDEVVAGEWDATLDLVDAPRTESDERAYGVKARLQILGVIREAIVTHPKLQTASAMAFRAAAAMFGIVPPERAVPSADHAAGHGRRNGNGTVPAPAAEPAYAEALHPTISIGATKEAAAERAADAAQDRRPPAVATTPREAEEMERRATQPPKPAATLDAETARCPKCDGQMWDNRATKRNPKAPDFKCRDRSCDGVIWPAREPKPEPKREPDAIAADGRPEFAGDDEIPF